MVQKAVNLENMPSLTIPSFTILSSKKFIAFHLFPLCFLALSAKKFLMHNIINYILISKKIKGLKGI